MNNIDKLNEIKKSLEMAQAYHYMDAKHSAAAQVNGCLNLIDELLQADLNKAPDGLQEKLELVQKALEDLGDHQSDGGNLYFILEPIQTLVLEVLAGQEGLYGTIESQKQTFDALVKKYKETLLDIQKALADFSPYNMAIDRLTCEALQQLTFAEQKANRDKNE